eukprot:GHRR01036741.1.p1 GENE.GHRR01036741.1~~GHRR01036741.1.p1  ORF type:complete len:135 (-),score=37.12 GHRR01036741.1:70-474(-)
MSCRRLACQTKTWLLSHAVTKRWGRLGSNATPYTSPVWPCISGSGNTAGACAEGAAGLLLPTPGAAAAAMTPFAAVAAAREGLSSHRSQRCVPSSSSTPPGLTSRALKLAGEGSAGSWNCTVRTKHNSAVQCSI